ncbi:MAG TPA: DUF1615 domain-containing protein [Usitatibacter sp.]|jgi:hypothetical protein|nr:DUF1615 domain-containing protein [Usitatibacter sp.]
MFRFRWARGAPALALALLVAACTAPAPRTPQPRPLTAAEGRALVARYLPPKAADHTGWSMDIYAAIAALRLEPSPQNICAIVAVAEQESGLQADPEIPNLRAIAQRALEHEREKAGIPKLVLDAALALPSTDGRSYGARIEAARTERELSDVFEDFIDRVPLGKRFLSDRNPVHTAGPMQVSVAFAQAHAARKPYPYGAGDSIRHEVFSRRGGIYFGAAHLLDYPAHYGDMIYRFADFNAGQYTSRNAAFQKAVSELSGIPLQLDGDLLKLDGTKRSAQAGSTELAVRLLGPSLGLGDAAIRRDLEHEKQLDFEETKLYGEVFARADEAAGRHVPRAVLPHIDLVSPKITRKLTTEWFARRADQRYRACLARGAA